VIIYGYYCLPEANVDMKQIRIKRDTGEAVLEGLPLEFSEIWTANALEEAVKLKEKAGSGQGNCSCYGFGEN